MQVFKNYAEYYDLLYKDKDYEAEVDFLESIFNQYSKNKISTILDLCCGTGSHAIILNRKGYKVTGVDASEVMLDKAKEKKQKSGNNIDFHPGDIRNFQLEKKFDCVTCMFAGFNYVIENDDIEKMLKNIHQHLAEDGIFICDIWNGLAVIRVLPSTRVKTVQDGSIKIIRTVEPELDAFRQISKNHYYMLVLENGQKVEEIKETHIIRYHFPQEIMYYFKNTGFEVLKMCAFGNLEEPVDENVWNIAVVAKKTGE